MCHAFQGLCHLLQQLWNYVIQPISCRKMTSVLLITECHPSHFQTEERIIHMFMLALFCDRWIDLPFAWRSVDSLACLRTSSAMKEMKNVKGGFFVFDSSTAAINRSATCKAPLASLLLNLSSFSYSSSSHRKCNFLSWEESLTSVGVVWPVLYASA